MKRESAYRMASPPRPGRRRRGLTYSLLSATIVGMLAAPPAAAAEEWLSEGAQAELLYVIKVTPTLVYLDGGVALLDEGDVFLILRDRKHTEMYDNVGEVRVIRIFDEFSIAEIVSIEDGQEIEVLDRAFPEDTWASMAATMFASSESGDVGDSVPAAGTRRWSLGIVGGVDLEQAVDLRIEAASGVITDAENVNGAGVGLRLARFLGSRVRLNATARLSGESLGGDADVSLLSLEIDLHYLFGDSEFVSPYIGAGTSVHRLSWDAAPGEEDSAFKNGFQGVGGVQIPLGDGGWNLTLEGGYQAVLEWDSIIDASNVRAYAGIGKSF